MRSACLVLATAAMTASAQGEPTGRVVRVERMRDATVPRMCVVMPSDSAALCVGEPELNERMTLVDSNGGRGVLAEVRITKVAEERLGGGFCAANGRSALYRASYERLAGDLRRVQGRASSGVVIGIRGMRLDARAQTLKDQVVPGGEPGDVGFALDVDGDGVADLLVAQYTCDRMSGSFSNERPTCIDTYLRQGRRQRLERVHQDVFRPCK
ncbi:MAG: hypothetical protein KF773_29075 [Deltaproteobacteria bacterium]|nr:hypothetical protein [Deltaproteobacteria bacterium]MCW5801729.1 hypothetical protein [Deltaproteobacteria bacterium]